MSHPFHRSIKRIVCSPKKGSHAPFSDSCFKYSPFHLHQPTQQVCIWKACKKHRKGFCSGEEKQLSNNGSSREEAIKTGENHYTSKENCRLSVQSTLHCLPEAFRSAEWVFFYLRKSSSPAFPLCGGRLRPTKKTNLLACFDELYDSPPKAYSEVGTVIVNIAALVNQLSNGKVKTFED